MEYTPLKISAKNLGYTALESFCPRCYWIKLKLSHKLPWQTFPGIFSSIDAYTKHCMHHIIDQKGCNPEWLSKIWDIVSYEPVLHWSKNKYHDGKSNITMHGAPDDIWVKRDGGKVIPDYKTAKHTYAQDQLFPMYEVQSNVYSVLIDNHAELCLVYMEPVTEQSAACRSIIDCGFNMGFNAVVVPINNSKSVVRQALTITRDIYEMEKPPDSAIGCKDCLALDNVMGALGMGKVSNAGLEE